MPPKKRPPAPIDRPLSKAYLRGFSGWSTAYPPGLSEPNSIREMENVMVTREGAARVRPGLRSYMRTKSPLPLVGSHELFYNEYGKAYLVAVRETVDVGTDDEREIVGFRVIGDVDGSGTIVMDTLANFGFDVPADPNTLAFTGQTTYVKYLQIDNKIFALSNAPEGMVMFWVGDGKKAKKLQSIDRPEWTVDDKLTAMHPDSAWVAGNVPSSTRRNLCRNPDFEDGLAYWERGSSTTAWWQSSAISSVGTRSLGFRSMEERINWVTSPLHDVDTTGLDHWYSVRSEISVDSGGMRVDIDQGATNGYGACDKFEVPAGARARVGYNLVSSNKVDQRLVVVSFYRANGDLIDNLYIDRRTNLDPGRKYTDYFTVPTQAAYARLRIGGYPSTSTTTAARVIINNVCMNYSDMSTGSLDGDDGADYYWEGTPNDSRSVYHPPLVSYVNSEMFSHGVVAGEDYTASADMRAPAGLQIELDLRFYDSSGSLIGSDNDIAIGNDAFQRLSVTMTAPSGTAQLMVRPVLRDGAYAERCYVDAVLIEKASAAGAYFSGATPDAGSTKRRWAAEPNASTSYEEVWTPVAPTVETPDPDTLVSDDKAKNRYTFSFFYTISNDLGESAASQSTKISVQRPWTAWEWLDATDTDTNDPELCKDQLVVVMPQEVFDAAVVAGATKWTAYFSTFGPNDVPPVTATRFAEIDLTNDPDHTKDGYARLTPQFVKIGVGDPLVPSESSRINATDPRKGSQGLVAADRLILVGNPDDPARISWSSGAPGDYHNFSSLLGGGTKQLTSGNLYLTGCVKLWQNPQSVDTLTILNAGDDGRSNAYYMQPAQITSLSESISVMGFEEVTGMFGTVSPYGCEVVSNALYRPLYHGLFKSTANNYNISTKPISDTIQNVWRVLQSPHHIVSSQLDSRIYFLVHNAFGETLEANCWGNEVWVVDLMAKTPTWSRWTVQGISLRAMDIDGVVMMSVVHPDGIFVFSEDRYTDEWFHPVTESLRTRNIKWYLETNTQGANRAHDAWCGLQQSNVQVGNFLGQMRYGIRGQDVNGMPIEMEKLLLSHSPPPADASEVDRMPTLDPTEREDYLLIQRTMKEWVFFAGSVNDEQTQNDVEDLTYGDELTSPARWAVGGFGYAWPQDPPTVVAEGMQFTWNPAPSQGSGHGFQGVYFELDAGRRYWLRLTVKADAGAARWRATQGFRYSSEWVTPDGSEVSMDLELEAIDDYSSFFGIEVENSDWPNAGTHIVTGFEFGVLVDADGMAPRFSGGQVNAVQYRYTPATVNVGYEYGSVETFEYGQIAQADTTTDSGTPKPYVDLSRA